MQVSLRLLMVEDSEDDAALLLLLLGQSGYEIKSERVESAGALKKALIQKWDLIISDHTMPHLSGVDALTAVRALDAEVPFIFVSGTIGEEVATDAMRNGAQDYIMKGNLKRLVPAEIALHNVVLRTVSHRVGRYFFANGAGDENEWNFRIQRSDGGKRVDAREVRHGVVGDDQIPFLDESFLQCASRFHAFRFDLVSALSKQ